MTSTQNLLAAIGVVLTGETVATFIADHSAFFIALAIVVISILVVFSIQSKQKNRG